MRLFSPVLRINRLCDKDGFQVPNPINRFAIGDRDRLTDNADGSLDIYIQAESPGPDKQSNWLPSPNNAPFQPAMRLYSPRWEVLDGTWSPPPIARRHANSPALDATPEEALGQTKAAWRKSGVLANGWRTNLIASGTSASAKAVG